jgi:hypothetical protein
MAGSASTLSALRRLVSERFPQAPRAVADVLPSGVAAVDDAVGGLPRQALTELVGAAPSGGSALFIGQLLHVTRRAGGRVALIDGGDAFDPASYPPDDMRHLVWLRCRTWADALPLADLFARDANLDLVMLDLRMAAKNVLRRIPTAAWYRLHRAVKPTHLALVVITPWALVPSAQLRLALESSHRLAAQRERRPRLAAGLPVARQRQRISADLAS